jgi:hypothetical protein
MISIRKYLYSAAHKRGSQIPVRDAGNMACEAENAVYETGNEAFFGFSAGVLDSIESYVLNGAQDESARSQVGELKEGLRPDWTADEASQALHELCRILATKNEAAQQKGMKQAVEMQHIFAMLNQALIVLAEGKDRSVARLNRIQESLQRAAVIDDMVALKSSLSETVRFVKAEQAQSQEASAKDLARFEQEISKARDFMGGARMEMSGRPEGVSRITSSLQSLAPGEGLFVVAFVLERLQAFLQRYGRPVAEELVFRVMKERVQPIAKADTAFRWTSSSLVAIFSSKANLNALRNQVMELNGAPLVHRIALGTRTAVLTIKPAHLVAQGNPEAPHLLIDQVDQFTGAAA